MALDAVYNACELAVKALILLGGEELARSHGRLIAQFGRLYVETGKASRTWAGNFTKP